MTADLSEDDRGKTVVSGSERIGTVAYVRSGTAYVDPDWDNVPDRLREELDWEESGDDQPLDESAVTEVQNSELRLRDDLTT